MTPFNFSSWKSVFIYVLLTCTIFAWCLLGPCEREARADFGMGDSLIFKTMLDHIEKQTVFEKRQAEALERIARALEKNR